MDASLRSLGGAETVARTLDVQVVYLEHAAFLWRSLQRLGIHACDLEDVLQEVLLVVHRRRTSYDPSRSQIRTWLFGICLRVVRGYRRRVRSRGTPHGDPPTDAGHYDTPESELDRRHLQQKLQAILDGMSVEKRAAFVLFELEGMRCEQIAELMGVPLGTVHSRIHAARAYFRDALARQGVEKP